MPALRTRGSVVAAGLLLLLVVAWSAGPPAAAQELLKGPDGISRSKVLVVGIDGLRWDLLHAVMTSGGAPNLRRLAARGTGRPTLLPYRLPEAATLSEVGWSTIATGVGPSKHGVRGVFINNDPGQATKRGSLDFLGRAERVRPRLSTFLASDWPNIALERHGGPIFSGPIDVRYGLDPPGTIDGYDAGDQAVAATAGRYLRDGDPDASFVYFGVVDEVAHILGSATPEYVAAIERTDARVGRLLRALRSRANRRRERWTILVTTDHGERHLDYGSILSHGLDSRLERTSLVIAAGRGITAGAAPGVLDIAPTVLDRLGIEIDPAWRLDGEPIGR